MQVFGRIYLIATLANILSGWLALSPAAANGSSREVLATDAVPAHAARAIPQTTIEANKLTSVLGIEVRTNTERKIGRIVDLLADRGGNIEAAIIEFGGFAGIGARKITVAWPALRLDMTDKQIVAVLDLTREQLLAFPEYRPDRPIVVQRVAPQSPRLQAAPTAAQPPAPKALPPATKHKTKRKTRHHASQRQRE